MTDMVQAKAFRCTDENREFLQCFIVEPIPADTKFVLASSEGYLFLTEDPGIHDLNGHIRMPHMKILSYYDIEYEK